jgi:prolyl oligopeptidase PreP (S9A serine peptidase family)
VDQVQEGTGGPDRAVIQVVDVKSGAIQDLGQGAWPIGSAEHFAFCDFDGSLYVTRFDNPNDETLVTPGRTCPRSAWRADSLVYLNLGTSVDEGAGVTVFIWQNGLVRTLEVPVEARGYGNVSWSANGTSLSTPT